MLRVHGLHLLHDHGQVADAEVQAGAEQAEALPEQVGGGQHEGDGLVQVVELLGLGVKAQRAGEPHVIQVLEHAVHVAVSGVDVGEDGADLDLMGSHASFQRLEPLHRAVLGVVGVVLQVVHVLLVVIQEGRDVIQLQLQAHDLQHQVMHTLRILADALGGGPQGGLEALDRFCRLGRGGAQAAEEPRVVLPVGDHLLEGQGLLICLPPDPVDPLGSLPHGEVDLVHRSLDVVALLGEVLQREVQAGCGGLPASHLGQEEPQRLVDLVDGEGAIAHLLGDLTAGGGEQFVGLGGLVQLDLLSQKHLLNSLQLRLQLSDLLPQLPSLMAERAVVRGFQLFRRKGQHFELLKDHGTKVASLIFQSIMNWQVAFLSLFLS